MAQLALPLHHVFWIMVITLVLFATLTSMIVSWTWAIGRFRAGRPLLPEPRPRAIPWGTGTVLIVFLAWLAVNVVVSVGYLTISRAHHDRRMPSFAEQMAVVSVSNGLLLVVIPPILRLTSRATPADLGVGRRDLSRNVLAGTVGFLLIAPLVYLLNGLAVLIWRQNKHPLEQMVLSEPTAGIACLAFLSAVVLAPAAEELIFRGIIQNWLGQLLRRPVVTPDLDLPGGRPPDALVPVDLSSVVDEDRVASTPRLPISSAQLPQSPGIHPHASGPLRSSLAPIVITSAVFAAVHLPQWPAPLAIFFLSIGLGAVYQRTGSLIASFLMHALFNGFSTMMLFQAVLLGHPSVLKTAPEATCVPRLTPFQGGKAPSALSRVHLRKTLIQERFSIGAGPGCQ